jgi:RNA polymerase sigma-70 factor, ECF subfamily
MLLVAESEQLPVAQARAGEPEAWDALFRRYQLPLYAYVFELLHDEQTSLDVVQDTFIAAVRHLDGLRDDSKFGGWLFGIAHQKCIQRWRKRTREETLREDLADATPEMAEGADELLLRREQEAEFMKLIQLLPPPQRAVLLLHFLEGFPLDEIAGIVDAPLGTVKSRLFHAKRTLRGLMESSVAEKQRQSPSSNQKSCYPT